MLGPLRGGVLTGESHHGDWKKIEKTEGKKPWQGLDEREGSPT